VSKKSENKLRSALGKSALSRIDKGTILL